LKLQITIDGKAYAVDVEVLEDDENFEPASDVAHHAPSAPLSGAHPQAHGGAWDAEARVCRSSLMGLVIKVNVKPGQVVLAGDLLIVLEAMKMETNVTAPRAGTIKTIHVVQGDSVKVDQVLVELE
jgi:methylmalonyl-CoA carboxyltransferase small subunit